MGPDNVANPMSDDTRLAAAGTCQDQEGPFDVLHSVSLTWVETFQEIHGLKTGESASSAAEDLQF